MLIMNIFWNWRFKFWKTEKSATQKHHFLFFKISIVLLQKQIKLNYSKNIIWEKDEISKSELESCDLWHIKKSKVFYQTREKIIIITFCASNYLLVLVCKSRGVLGVLFLFNNIQLSLELMEKLSVWTYRVVLEKLSWKETYSFCSNSHEIQITWGSWQWKVIS